VPGSRNSDLLLNPWQGPRQIPRPAPGGGRTIAEIAQVTKKHRSTVARHLNNLKGRGLVIEETTPGGRRVWWRLRFDPDQIADRDQIPDTAEAKATRHKRERLAFLLSLSKERSSYIKREICETGLALIDSRTGEILNVLPEDLLGQLE
jgi:DNA-binding IclR family transcriptional regulator